MIDTTLDRAEKALKGCLTWNDKLHLEQAIIDFKSHRMSPDEFEDYFIKVRCKYTREIDMIAQSADISFPNME